MFSIEDRDGIHHGAVPSDSSVYARMGSDSRNHLTVDVVTPDGLYGTMHAPTDNLEDRVRDHA